MRKATLFGPALVLVLTAGLGCGGDDDNSNSADASIDAAPVTDAPPLSCTNRSIPENLGTISDAPFSAIADDRGSPGGPITLRVTALIDRSAPPNPKDDTFSMRFFEGFTVFNPEFATGEFDIAGADTNFFGCGACLHIIGDYDPGDDIVGQHYVADSGTLSLTEISTTAGLMVTGTVTNAHFRQVTLDTATSTQLDVPGGCEATLDELTFSAPVQVP